MKKQIEQLTNVELDYLAAKALGYNAFVRTSQARPYPHVWVKHKGIFSPTSEPKDMVNVMQHAKISIQSPIEEDIYWTAFIRKDVVINPIERRDILAKKRSFELSDAVVRCFIAFVYGDTADVGEIREMVV
ncbi:MAG: hypothetical protein ACXVH2_00825 [Methanobacterium sp.]